MNQRPTFVQNGASSSPTVGGSLENSNQTQNQKRQETGAIWKRNARNGAEFLTLKVELSKEQLEALIANMQTVEYMQAGEKVTKVVATINLVAFTNKNQGGDGRKPAYRIYEEYKQQS